MTSSYCSQIWYQDNSWVRVIHLAGVGVGDKRWNKKYKSQILNSRLLGTETIAKAVAEVKPQVFISASAIGWYGESGNRAVVESDRVGDDFLAAVCREWEAAADIASPIRTVKLRTGLVLDPTGGFTDVLLKRGVQKVIAVDVGYGQLAWSLQNDERVKILDRVNVRTLTKDIVGESVDLIVADLSFISLKLVLPALISVAKDEADFLVRACCAV